MLKLLAYDADKKFLLTQKAISYLFPALAVIGILAPLAFHQYNLSLLGSYLAIPLFFSPLIFRINRQNPIETKILDNRLFKLASCFYFILFSTSIFLLYRYEVRPLSYYIIIALLSIIILLQILLFDISKNRILLILCQCIILLLNIIFGVTINYFYYISRTDPIAHVWLIECLANYGHVTKIFGEYQPFPLWHILVYSVTQLSGSFQPLHKIMFLINGLIYSFLIIIVYLISKKIFRDETLAMLSALFAIFYPDILIYGMASLPRSTVSFLLILLILVYEKSVPKRILAIILTLSIAIYHTASMPFILFILIILYVLQKIYLNKCDKSFINLNYIILITVITISYWMYFAQELIFTLLRHASLDAPSGILTKSVIDTPFNELFNYLQYIPILFFALIGILYSLSSKRLLNFEKNFFITGLLLSAVSFPGPSLLINKLAKNFNLGRFGEYGFLFIILAMAFGFHKLFSKSGNYHKMMVIIIFAVMAFLSISNDFVASDNPLVKRPFYTFYLTEDEVDSSYKLASFAQGRVMSDYITTRFLSFSPYTNKSHLLEVDPNKKNFLRNNNSNLILLREGELSKRPLSLYSSEGDSFKLEPDWTTLEYYYQGMDLWRSLKNYNNIFESNDMEGYC